MFKATLTKFIFYLQSASPYKYPSRLWYWKSSFTC